ncbi:response regulator transcription factor [Paraburkholderia sediminicola]|uniref:response regulator transcription factor n=1 Tax=Paraburkholderia sediminicola TaxID=458836 RepID=UPI0038BB3B7F
MYTDGSRAELWTDADALRHTFLEKKYIVGAYTPSYYSSEDRYVILESRIQSFRIQDRDRYVAQIIDQRELFGHAHPFKIVNIADEYCEYFIYYSPVNRRHEIEGCVNNLEVLANFSEFFKNSAATLIRNSVNDRIVGAMNLGGNYQEIGGNNFVSNELGSLRFLDISLTERQLEIARHLLAGRTARDIADRLDISRRTAETHVENMKSRLGCLNKSELVIKLACLNKLFK